MHRVVSCFFSGILWLLATAAFPAGVFQWTDSDGVRHFSDQPPRPESIASDLAMHELPEITAPAEGELRKYSIRERYIAFHREFEKDQSALDKEYRARHRAQKDDDTDVAEKARLKKARDEERAEAKKQRDNNRKVRSPAPAKNSRKPMTFGCQSRCASSRRTTKRGTTSVARP